MGTILDDGNKSVYSDTADGGMSFASIESGMFPALRMLGIVGSITGFNQGVRDNFKLYGETWHVYNISTVPMPDNAYLLRVIYIADLEYKMMRPTTKRYNTLDEMAKAFDFSIADDKQLKSRDIKCGPGRTPREIIYALMIKYNLEVYLDNKGVHFIKPGNRPSSGPPGRRVSDTWYTVPATKTTENVNVYTSFYTADVGTSNAEPAIVLTGGRKILFVSRTIPMGEANVIIETTCVDAPRVIDVATLAGLGGKTCPPANEIRESWKDEVTGTKAFICKTQGDDLIRYYRRDWFTGRDEMIQDHRKTSHHLLPFYASPPGNDAYYCIFPTSAVGSRSSYESLVLLPELEMPDTSPDYISRSIQMGVPVANEDREKMKLPNTSTLEFKLPGSVTKAGVTESGTLKWAGGQSAGSNSWTVETVRGVDKSTITVKSGEMVLEKGTTKVTMDGSNVVISAGTRKITVSGATVNVS